MKSILEKKQAERLRLLLAVYEDAKGSIREPSDARTLAARDAKIGETVKDSFDWLKAKGYLRGYAAGMTCLLTHEGIEAAEAILSDSKKGFGPFPSFETLLFEE